MGVCFFSKGKVDENRKSYFRGFKCRCGAYRTLPNNAKRINEFDKALSSETLRNLYRTSALSYGLSARLGDATTRHNLNFVISHEDSDNNDNQPSKYLGLQEIVMYINLSDLEVEFWESLIRDDPIIGYDLDRYEGLYVNDYDEYDDEDQWSELVVFM